LLVSAALNVTNVNTNDASVKIYPNPATTGMIVAYSFAQQAEATVTVTDLLGQTVMTHDLGKNMAGNMYLSLDGIPSGIYLVTVSNGISEKVIRLAKQ
jgi:flagellar hook assembly protein FlgD